MANLDIFGSFQAMSRTLRVGLLLFPGCMPAGLLAFADMLHAANRRTGLPLFEARFIALQSGPIACAHGLVLQATHALNDGALEAILIPGFWAESAQHIDKTLAANADLVAALSRQGKRCQLWSYCVGVCLTAASGRLNNQCATVTWWLADTMLKRYPKIRWQSEKNCIFNESNATATGVNGYLPIAQSLIERHVSPAVFRDLIKLMVLPRPALSHDAFQAISLIEQPSRLLRQVHALVERLPAEQITLLKLAIELGMSERSLARKIRGETGVPAAAYARRIKLSQVSERLTLTSASVSSISAELGFSSDSNMRRMFKELTALTPAKYRQRFSRC
ncbi:helix-turn-helix domain-containing protein [Pseudomonas stutzeri]|uniref:GlxA family transcriptional regulator n=1 Tax=Stutzerimonas stutzeri TaxID=316 RepID=UPI00210F225D|nr:helix-turn-helix domain-containing protein [Stutzerimonas stutzeri]MCQ4312217.1 helix-turn-helix domain-containing protein [Stutzerimonas stutzeri]